MDKELISLRLFKEDALERIADDERVISEQEAMIAEMHKVISQCADALDVAKYAIVGYIDIKDSYHKKAKRCS
jgi:hypothetical protein